MFEIIAAASVLGSCIIIAWSLVAGAMACIMCISMLWTVFRTGPVWVGDSLERQIEEILGDGHYIRLFGIGAGIPALTALIAMEAAYTYNVSSNTAWIFWFCTWAYGFWCLFRQFKVVYCVRKAHFSTQKALHGA